jgi:hypothetical protein
MNTTVDHAFASALRAELVALPSMQPRRTRRRIAVISAGVVGALSIGGVAVAGLRPAGEVASPPLAPPVILNGVGPANVVLPKAPGNATYVQVELTCYDGTRCHTPGGGNDGPATSPKIQRAALPLTNRTDPTNAQQLSPLDPSIGLPVAVNTGTHWRLYVVYTADLTPAPAPVGNGETLGVPGNDVPPDLVPATATNGKAGWVNYRSLTDQASPTLTPDGTRQAPIPVYGADGTTVIGEADVSQAYR